MDRQRLLLGVLAIVPAATMSVVSLATELPNFFDPCFEWSAGNPSRLTPSDECPQVSATTESRSEVVRRLILVQGMILVACTVGVVGSALGKRWLIAPAIAYLVIVSVPLMFGVGFVFTLASALLFLAPLLYSAQRARPPAGDRAAS